MKLKRLGIGLTIAVIVVLAIASIAVFSIVHQKADIKPSDGSLVLDTYKFEREIEIEGKKHQFYQSGTDRYKYDHDEDGNILLQKDQYKYLEYAVKKDGKIVSSGVSLGSDASSIEKLSVNDIDVNDEAFKVEQIKELAPRNKFGIRGDETKTVTNLVVYLKFKDESTTLDSFQNKFSSLYPGMNSYYSSLSLGKLNILSQAATKNSVGFVYEAPNTRAYYNEDGTGTARREKEYELVQGLFTAINKAETYPSHGDLDVLGPSGSPDGYIDSVSVLVSNSSAASWGGLLWPHKWNVTEILSNVPSDKPLPEMYNGKKFGDYTFNFISSIDLGTVCHEMGHVIGAPDYYHYNGDFVPVGEWELMAQNKSTPQYMLTRTRSKYIGGVADNLIQNITASGVYTAYATSLSRLPGELHSDKPLAYKIPTNRANEYIMIEMRSREITAPSYDSVLPGSGLIIYRVIENIYGNDAAEFHRPEKADEIFVFRPDVYMKNSTASGRFRASYQDANLAYLSPNNSHFSSVGKATETNKYDYSTIFYRDGTNTKIVIDALNADKDSVQFNVRLAGDEGEDVSIGSKFGYIGSNLFVDSTAGTSGVEFNFNVFQNLDLTKLKNVQMKLYNNASGEVFSTANINIARFKTIYNPANSNLYKGRFYLGKSFDINNLFSHSKVLIENADVEDEFPDKIEMSVYDMNNNKSVIGEAKTIDKNSKTWMQITRTLPQVSIYASSAMSIAMTKDGKVLTNKPEGHTTGQNSLMARWDIDNMTDYLTLAIGHSHVIAITKELEVRTYGYDIAGEMGADNWKNIISVAAGYASSYGLTINGDVYARGLNDKGQILGVAGWENITSISAQGKVVAAVNQEGKIEVAGDLEDSVKTAIQSKSGVRQVSVGEKYVAVLYSNSTVELFGRLATEENNAIVSQWTNINKISAGANFVVALDKGGKIKGAGTASFDLTTLNDLIDIIDIAAGEQHAMFLREDGIVEYRGENVNYDTNKKFENLIYYAPDDYKEVDSLEVVSDFDEQNPTELIIDKGTSAELSRKIYIKTKSGSSLSTYKRLTYSTTQVPGKQPLGTISIQEGVVPKTGNEAIDEPSELNPNRSTYIINGLTEGFVRIIFTSKSGNISWGIDVEVVACQTLNRILIDGVKLDSDGNPDLSTPSVYVKEYLESETTPPARVKLNVIKDPIDTAGFLREIQFAITEGADLAEISVNGLVQAKKGKAGSFLVKASAKHGGSIYETYIRVGIIGVINKIEPKYVDGSTVVEMKYGSAIDFSKMKIKVTKNEDAGGTSTSEIQVGSSMVLGTYTDPDNVSLVQYNSRVLGPRYLRVSYMGKECDFNISVYDYITNIEVLNPKKTYKLQEGVSASDMGNVKLSYASGATPVEVAYDNNTYGNISNSLTSTPNLTVKTGIKIIEVTYTMVVKDFKNQLVHSYEINVVDYATEIKFENNTDLVKRKFEFGEDIKSSPEVFILTMKSGLSTLVDISKVEITGYDSYTLGEQTLDITYINDVGETVAPITDKVEVTILGNLLLTGGEDVNLASPSPNPSNQNYENIELSPNNEGPEFTRIYFYMKGGELFIEKIELRLVSGKIFEIPLFVAGEMDNEPIYYKFQEAEAEATSVDTAYPNRYYKDVAGEIVDVSLEIYTKVSGYQPHQLVARSYIKTMGVLSWEILGVKEGGAYPEGKGIAGNPLDFDYGEYSVYPDKIRIGVSYTAPGNIDLEFSPRQISFDRENVDVEQNLSIVFAGQESTDACKKYYVIRINDVVDDIELELMPELEYGTDLMSILAPKKVKRKAGLVPLTADEITNKLVEITPMTMVVNEQDVDINRIVTDDGVLAPSERHNLTASFTIKGQSITKAIKLKVYDICTGMSTSVQDIEMGYKEDLATTLAIKADYENRDGLKVIFTQKHQSSGAAGLILSFKNFYSYTGNTSVLADDFDLNLKVGVGEVFSNQKTGVKQKVELIHKRTGRKSILNVEVKNYIKTLKLMMPNENSGAEPVDYYSKAWQYEDLNGNNIKQTFLARAYHADEQTYMIYTNNYVLEGKHIKDYDGNTIMHPEYKDLSTFVGKSLDPGTWLIRAKYIKAGEYFINENDIYTTEKELVINNYLKDVGLSLKPNALQKYLYGQAVRLGDLVVDITWKYPENCENKVTLLSQYITDYCDIVYNAMKYGRVQVSVLPKAKFRKDISIKASTTLFFESPEASNTLKIAENKVFNKTRVIESNDEVYDKTEVLKLDESNTIIELLRLFHAQEYLYYRYTRENGALVINPQSSAEKVHSGDLFELKNELNYTIFRYKIYLKGDANGDGIVDVNDEKAMAKMILGEKEYVPEIMIDDEENKDILTNFVKIVRKISNTVPSNTNLPINNMARTFISYLTCGAKEEEILTVETC